MILTIKATASVVRMLWRYVVGERVKRTTKDNQVPDRVPHGPLPPRCRRLGQSPTLLQNPHRDRNPYALEGEPPRVAPKALTAYRPYPRDGAQGRKVTVNNVNAG